MANRVKSQNKGRRRTTTASWLALVAATSLGLAEAVALRAEVSVPRDILGGGRYRLIIQSYDDMAENRAIPASSRPRGSAQRAVTAADLKQGIQVDLIELGERALTSSERRVVIAWLERGEPTLEFDARRARPAAGSVYGITRSSQAEPVKIVLDRRLGSA
jgi:hypothetical protein